MSGSSNLADEPSSADGPEERWLAYHYTKLGRWAYIGWWPPSTRREMTCIPLCKNLGDEPTLAKHNGKGLKALAFTISQIPHSIFSKHIFAEKVAFFHS